MKVKRAPAPKGVDAPLETFEHTHIAVYLCALFAVACVCYDSVQVSCLCIVKPLFSLTPVPMGTRRRTVCANVLLVVTELLLLQGVMQKYAINRKWFYLYGNIPCLYHPSSCLKPA